MIPRVELEATYYRQPDWANMTEVKNRDSTEPVVHGTRAMSHSEHERYQQ